jgi:hypothetical protein
MALTQLNKATTGPKNQDNSPVIIIQPCYAKINSEKTLKVFREFERSLG